MGRGGANGETRRGGQELHDGPISLAADRESTHHIAAGGAKGEEDDPERSVRAGPRHLARRRWSNERDSHALLGVEASALEREWVAVQDA